MPNIYNSSFTGQHNDEYDDRISTLETEYDARITALENFRQTFLDTIYPVGSIYISTQNVNPGTLFGGTWEQIEDKFLLGASTTYAVGTTGGTATTEHTHTMEHTHNEGDLRAAIGASANDTKSLSYVAVARHDRGPASVSSYTVIGASSQTTTRTFNHYTQVYGFTGQASNNTTSSSNLNNMPPYLSVYMWKRTV